MYPIEYSHITSMLMLWLAYFFLHSFAASLTLKHWVANHFPALMPGYRLTFNLLSGVLLLPIFILSYLWRGEPLWQWPTVIFWLTIVIAVVTVIAFIFSLRYYDMDEFLGTKQWREGNNKVEDQEGFVIGDFHRFVRHPWYTMAIVLIWCREHDPVMLTNAIMMTLYFIVGSRFEERKLLQYHGDVYKRYMERVPGLLPRPWRFLRREEAAKLLAGAD